MQGGVTKTCNRRVTTDVTRRVTTDVTTHEMANVTKLLTTDVTTHEIIDVTIDVMNSRKLHDTCTRAYIIELDANTKEKCDVTKRVNFDERVS